MIQTLEIETADHDPFAIMTLHGALAGSTVYELKHAGNRLIEYLGRHYIVLDLGDVTFIDSAGIGVMVYFFQACKNMGGRLVAVMPRNAEVMRPINQGSLERFISFSADLAGALEGLCSRSGLQLPPALRAMIQPAEAAVSEEIKTLKQRVMELEQRVATLENRLKSQLETA